MKPEIRWGELAVCQPQVAASDDVACTPNGNSLAVLLSGRQIVLDGEDAPLSASYVASLRIPVETPEGEELVGYRTDIRGFASSSFGGSLVLVADIGGVAHAFRHCFDEEEDGDFTHTVFSLAPPTLPPTAPQRDEAEASEQPVQEEPGYSPDYQPVEAEAAGPVRPFPLTINLALFGVRRTLADHARMEIDSLDVQAIWR